MDLNSHMKQQFWMEHALARWWPLSNSCGRESETSAGIYASCLRSVALV